MDELELVSPIKYLALNQCPQCEGLLELTEKEIFISSVNKRGEIIDSDSEYKMSLKCKICGSVFDADKKGNHFFVSNKLTPIVKKKIIKEYNPFQIY